jgi:hypothetical protein
MKEINVQMEEIDESELPVSGVVRVQRRKGYGTVADLDDEAPASICELQRMVAWQMYAPLLALAGRKGRGGRIVLDASGEVDWEAVGPAGGRRRRATPGVVGRAGQLRRELGRVVGLIGLLEQRVPGTAKYLVLKYVRMGILDLEHVSQHELRQVAQLEARARALRAELDGLRTCSQRMPPQPELLVAGVRW